MITRSIKAMQLLAIRKRFPVSVCALELQGIIKNADNYIARNIVIRKRARAKGFA